MTEIAIILPTFLRYHNQASHRGRTTAGRVLLAGQSFSEDQK